MSIVDVMARIQAIESAFVPQQAAPAAQPATATTKTSFDSALQGAMGTGVKFGATGATGAAAPTTAPGTTAGQAIVNAARREIGQAEQPPGSNDSPRIAMYRQATAGSGVGPWCAYFASWAGRQAGVPLGDHGQGFGAVSDVWAWAQRSGKALPAGSKPAPGDLIVWNGRHIGIVESVEGNG